jgi:hypothetical protein
VHRHHKVVARRRKAVAVQAQLPRVAVPVPRNLLAAARSSHKAHSQQRYAGLYR